MEDTRKEICFYGMKPGKALKRQVERQIQKWLVRHGSFTSTDEASCRVSIGRENGSCLCCHLQIQVGSQLWESYDVGKNVPDALAHALQHVAKPITQTLLKNVSQVHHVNMAGATA